MGGRPLGDGSKKKRKIQRIACSKYEGGPRIEGGGLGRVVGYTGGWVVGVVAAGDSRVKAGAIGPGRVESSRVEVKIAGGGWS